MKKNLKNAFIDKIMIGFVLISSILAFVATVSDELKVRNKHKNLKKIVQTVVLSSSKYYISEDNATTEEAEDIALGIVSASQLGSILVQNNDIDITWYLDDDPQNVIASISNYEESMFWYELFGWEKFKFDKIEAKANIILNPLDELPVIDETDEFMPFAINECGQGDSIMPGDNLSFIYKAYEQYESNESLGFYGLDSTLADGDNQSAFAEFKNNVDKLFGGDPSSYNRLTTQQYLVNSEYDSDESTNPINNDASQLASSLEVHKFDDPLDITVALIDCSSTKDNIIISNLIQVSMTNIYCGDKATSDSNIDSAFEDQTGDVFEDVTWVEWVEGFDCSQSGLFRIDLEVKIPDEEETLLVY